MRLVAAILSFTTLLGSNLYFSLGYGKGVYMQDYTYGELVYQCGIIVAIITMFLYYRWGAKGWGVKLFLNWIIEIYLIALYFTVRHNPYSLNWDKILFLQISLCGIVVLYLVCYLFPNFRRMII